MTADTTLRIWTPLNTVATLRVSPTGSVADALQQVLASTGLVSLILGDISDNEGWYMYTNYSLPSDLESSASFNDSEIQHRFPKLNL